MPPKSNPLRLNSLQLRTLCVLQQLARAGGHAAQPEGDGAVAVGRLPHAHGDHFHLGDATVLVKDCTGLGNPAVFNALARKGLLRASQDGQPLLTSEGLGYDTGVAQQILRRHEP